MAPFFALTHFLNVNQIRNVFLGAKAADILPGGSFYFINNQSVQYIEMYCPETKFVEESSILKRPTANKIAFHLLPPPQQHYTFHESQALLADIVFIPIKTTPLYSHSKKLHPMFDFSPLTQPLLHYPLYPVHPHI